MPQMSMEEEARMKTTICAGTLLRVEGRFSPSKVPEEGRSGTLEFQC